MTLLYKSRPHTTSFIEAGPCACDLTTVQCAAQHRRGGRCTMGQILGQISSQTTTGRLRSFSGARLARDGSAGAAPGPGRSPCSRLSTKRRISGATSPPGPTTSDSTSPSGSGTAAGGGREAAVISDEKRQRAESEEL